jgi:hypothetical protein
MVAVSTAAFDATMHLCELLNRTIQLGILFLNLPEFCKGS